MAEQLKTLYKIFVRDKVNKEYIYYNENCKILGENFVGKYYLLLMEDWNRTKDIEVPDFHLLIENCKASEVLKFKRIHKSNGYIRISKQILEDNEKIFKLLIKQGLFMKPETAYNWNNTELLVHRLNLCLYNNIIGFECHHGDKDKTHNGITNLTPIKHENHKLLDIEPLEIFEKHTKELHDKFVEKIFKEKRNTLSSRDKTVFHILLELSAGLSVTQIAKRHSKRIGETSIQKIKNHYFYCNEFLKYLYHLITTGDSPFVEDFEKQWFEPLKFDINEGGNRQLQYELFDYMQPYLKRMFEKT